VALFLSTFTKKIDKKGRVSVPSSFRAVLESEEFSGIIVYQSFINACVEACSMSRLEALSERIETLDPFSEEHDAFSSTILGGSMQLPFDGEGRVVLPPELLASVGIEDEAVFVGKGKTFEIWNPVAFAAHAEASRKLALDKRDMLRAGNTQGAA
jgi:MraZ protein